MIASILHAIALVKTNPAVWAQAIHFGFGLVAMLLAYRAGVRRRFWPVSLAIIVGAFAIEIWYDPTYEHSPFVWDGVRDLGFYALGIATGWLVDRL